MVQQTASSSLHARYAPAGRSEPDHPRTAFQSSPCTKTRPPSTFTGERATAIFPTSPSRPVTTRLRNAQLRWPIAVKEAPGEPAPPHQCQSRRRLPAISSLVAAPERSSLLTGLGPSLAAAPELSSLLTGLDLVDNQSPALELKIIQLLNSCLGFRLAAHFDKTKPFRASRLSVRDDLNRLDGSMFRKKVSQARLGRRVGQTTYIQLVTMHVLLQENLFCLPFARFVRQARQNTGNRHFGATIQLLLSFCWAFLRYGETVQVFCLIFQAPSGDLRPKKHFKNTRLLAVASNFPTPGSWPKSTELLDVRKRVDEHERQIAKISQARNLKL